MQSFPNRSGKMPEESGGAVGESCGGPAIRPLPGFQTLTRTTPIPILPRTRSGYLRRAFSANFLVLKGFDRITSSRPWYSNSSQRTEDFIYLNFSTTERLSPVRVTVMNPVAVDAFGGTSLDPESVAVKIPSAFTRGAVSKAPASSRKPSAIFRDISAS